ncbi:MAG: rhamnulokinase, partial [Planctomycetaceae bacterium]|nr:rhamnulokinase [Planctomycetaceae bacterium]
SGGVVDGRLTLGEVHRFENDPVHVQNRMHWNLLGLWQQIRKGLSIAAGGPSQVLSVGVDSWGVDYVFLDRNGDWIGPGYHYRDARTRGMLRQAFDVVDRSTIFEETGLQFMEINTLYQLHAAKLGDSPILNAGCQFMMIADFFHWLLTGKASIEYTNASTTQLYNTRQQGWSQRLLERFGLPANAFTPVLQP